MLIILAHPDMQNSRINKAFCESVAQDSHITIHDLYANYPHWRFDVQKEQDLLREHATIIFQFPIFWYSCPPLLKKYFDDVFTYGFAYGTNGTVLQGKKFGLCVSFGDYKESFELHSRIGFSVDSLLAPFQATFRLVSGTYIGHFATFRAMRNISDEDIAKQVIQYKQFLENIEH